MACPFFVPVSKSDDIAWLHSPRLPLGAGWSGRCDAPGHEGALPSPQQLKDLCNMGYAELCPRLPRQRAWDAVRFAVSRDHGSRLELWFVCELGHRPAGHGVLEYDVGRRRWTSRHPDERVQNLADCYLQSYWQRRGPAAEKIPVAAENQARITIP